MQQRATLSTRGQGQGAGGSPSREIHCRFVGEVKYPPQLRLSEKSGRTWCRLAVMVAAGSFGEVGVVCFGGRARRVCDEFRPGDVVEVEGRLSLWWNDRAERSELSVISTSIKQPGCDVPSDVASLRARRSDAEVVLGREG
jgi:hypothetical protein